MSEDRIRLLHGPDVEQALEEASDLTVYPYQLNTPVYGLVAALTAAMGAGVGLMAWGYGQFLGSVAGSVIFWGLIALDAAVVIMSGYWWNYARNYFVATSKEALFVGSGHRLWRVAWPLLDRRSVGLEEMELSIVGTSLDIEAGGQQIPIRVFNPFVRIGDMEGLMGHILEQIKETSSADETS
jgi:hypothetical protein